MKGLSLATVVFGLTCLSIHAYPVWNEQKECLEDTNPKCTIDYDGMKDRDLLVKLIKDENRLQKVLRDLARDIDDHTMNFLGGVQSINSLREEISVSGMLAEKLHCEKISAPTAIYIYQIMFSDEEEEDLGESFDEYVKGMISNPFAN